jgi:hypothetical protein
MSTATLLPREIDINLMKPVGCLESTFWKDRTLMTIEQMRDAWHAQPFKPFVIHLADGRQLPVQSKEYLSSSPSGRTFVVWQPDDHMNIVDLLLVTGVEFKSTANGGGRRRKA